jgi:type III restriction enzyme
MPDVIIENPVINSPYEEPSRHFVFGKEGITNETAIGRRSSSYFIPIAAPKKKGQQLAFETEWTKDRLEENAFINRVREQVALWRQGGFQGVTPVSRSLLEYWQNPDRYRRLFFCQIEAAQTAIFLTEVAGRYGAPWIENQLLDANRTYSQSLSRIAFKVATGGGKTVVMGMLIAWQALNKIANSKDARFSDTFLVVTPGITIRDRLRVLLPNDPATYYREMDIVSPDQMEALQQANLLITNYHAFILREKGDAARLTKQILTGGNGKGAFIESADEMVRRVCRDFGNKKNIIVLNDEAHHCYRRKPDAEGERLSLEERREAVENARAAEVWISGLEAIKGKIGIKAVYDLSATPFFLRGSGYPEGTLFPWVVSDFGLIDAIESGIVKVPRVPVSDNRLMGDLPTYRDLWLRIKTELPKKGRTAEAEVKTVEPKLPIDLESALQSLYGNYEESALSWEQAGFDVPPVFIVVCSNTRVSKLVYDYVAGWERTLPDGSTRVVPGKLRLFSNEKDGDWSVRPRTILVDSVQLESGEAMSTEFKKIAANQIAEVKAEYRTRFPGRDPEELTDEDLLREVMNTVGKAGKLGERVRCVVSVSMLTEGWDANTVTHILGVRAFGTQLLCEQVVGRGLRRSSYVPDDDGRLRPEYAEVYGVPFSFIPTAGSTPTPKLPIMPTRVRALSERSSFEIRFPLLSGYRYEVRGEKLQARFGPDSKMSLSARDVVTKVELDPIVGESSIHTLDALRECRMQEVTFLLAKRTLEMNFADSEGNPKVWLFPQLVQIARQWLDECLTCSSEAFPQLLMLAQFSYRAAEHIYAGIIAASADAPVLKGILRVSDPVGTTAVVDFDTIKDVYPTVKSHVNYVAAHTNSWEQKLAQTLEDMPEVISYVKNEGLRFTIPYTIEGQSANYLPDFIARVDIGAGEPVNLIIEVTGQKRKEKEAKASTARNLWVPAVNNNGGFGTWAYIEITDPWFATDIIRNSLKVGVPASG